MLQGHEPGARERIEGGFLLDKSSEGVAGLAAMALRLPSRVLIRCQSGQLPLCEYQSRACPLMCPRYGVACAAAFARCCYQHAPHMSPCCAATQSSHALSLKTCVSAKVLTTT